MSNYHSAWATLTGKVFVSEYAVMLKLSEAFPDRMPEFLKDNKEVFDVCTAEEIRAAFEEVAKEKINALFPTDEPMKLNEVEIDMDSYKS